MDHSNNMPSVNDLENSFFDGAPGQDSKLVAKERNSKKRIQLRHLYWIPSLVYKRIYKTLPGILKDTFFWASSIHKSPASTFIAKTRYDQLRTLIDIKVSNLTLNNVPDNILKKVESTFESGFHISQISDLSELDSLIKSVLSYATPSHAGARPYFKDGKNISITNSFSQYYTFSDGDNKKINLILEKNLDSDFTHHLSALAGYKCSIKDISYTLGIVYGENSNSEMHQDTYSSVAKGFLYLQDIDEGDSPFQYLVGSYLDASFRSHQTNRAVLDKDSHSSGSTRLRGKVLDKGINLYELKSFTGPKGMFIFANTAGYHRKGPHNSNKPRITLACGVKRKGIISKLFINLFN